MKAKRTYRLSVESIAAVKRLAEVDHIAPTQDAVVEQAIEELARSVRDARDAVLWTQAASDPTFGEEARGIDALFVADDATAWDEE